MRVLIKQSYNDRNLDRTVRAGEELSVSEQRAQQLIKSGVAEKMSDDISDYIKQIATMETALTERDKRISELETENAAQKEQIATMETALKAKK